MTSNMTMPAAEYVRMSTEDQQYSIANQQAAIEEYAARHGFCITRIYSDAGRSGVVIKRRDGLNRLLQDVIGGQADYKAILVYDISRWGRFQDTDEAAHYEFLCKQAGIPIHYCAEQFANDGTVPSSILKALKRTMAGEYSRELSVKVFDGQRRLTLLGFRMGGAAGYGLSRMIVSKDGQRKRKLRAGEWKSITTDRVILVPGPKKEVECVRQIFSMTVAQKTPRQISDELNRKGTKYLGGHQWNKLAVYRILRNPEYAGYSAWGRTSQRLHTRLVRLPRSEWTIKRGSFVPIVDEATFQRAQEILLKRKTYPRRSDEELLEKLKRVLDRHGELSERIISRSRGVFHQRTYWKRFGSLLRCMS
jgi:DNA invertase Pin-like site-specific DNA recombinase